MRLHEFHDYIAEKKLEETSQAATFRPISEVMGSLEAPSPSGADGTRLQSFHEFVAFAGRIEQHLDRIRATEHLGHKIDALAELMVEMATMPEVQP